MSAKLHRPHFTRLASFALLGIAASLTFLTGCLVNEPATPSLASAEVVADFGSYPLRRVGLMPFRGTDLPAEQARAIRSAFFTEVSRATPYEVIPLTDRDIAEVPDSEPFRRGVYRTRTIIELTRRFQLDAILVGTVTELQSFPPQRLSVQMEMVAAETGLVVWSGNVHLDARNAEVRDAIQAKYGDVREEGDESWEVILLSPRRFAQFAAAEISRLL